MIAPLAKVVREPRSRAQRASPEFALAPFVRAPRDLAGELRIWLLALAPCVLVGAYNAGARANEALAGQGLARASGWRGAVLDALGIPIDAGSAVGCFAHGALILVPLAGVALLVGAAWEQLFARVRRRERAPGLALVALLFALSLPPALPLWQAALGMSFGLVLGRELFGGTGRNVFHPVLVGLAFLQLSYPSALRGAGAWVAAAGASAVPPITLASGGEAALAEAGVSWWTCALGFVPGALGTTSALAALAGAFVLLAARVASWRVMVGVLAGAGAAACAFRLASPASLPIASLAPHWHLALGGFAFGVVFLATDPVTGAATDAGRWITGFLVGAIAITVRVANPLQPDGVLLALLCGNAVAPLVDHGVVALHVARRRRRLARA